MKALLLTFFIVLLAFSARAQAPPVGNIDFYGLRTLTEAQVRAALGVREGDARLESYEAAEKRLLALPNVAQADISLACCDDVNHKSILYVGIRETGTPPVAYRAAPTGKVRLPDAVMKEQGEFFAALSKAVVTGDAGEDDSQGHALFNNPEARRFQLRFIKFAAQNLKLLRRVLRESANAEQRAAATEIIAYYGDKRQIVDDLVYAADDADGTTRNNALRALSIIAQYAQNAPEKRIRVPFEPFIKTLNSLRWTDRNKSSFLLFQLTAKPDAALYDKLRRDAARSLDEIARWKNPGHAMPAFVMLGRINGLTDDEIFKIWQTGDRERLFEKIK